MVFEYMEDGIKKISKITYKKLEPNADFLESKFILQPETRVKVRGKSGAEYYVETGFPYLDRIGKDHVTDFQVWELKKKLRLEGIDFWDNKPDNIAIIHGEPIIIDSGAVVRFYYDSN